MLFELHGQHVARLGLPPLQRAAAVPRAYAAQEPMTPLAYEAAGRGHGRARAAPDLYTAEDGTRGDGGFGDDVQHGLAGRGGRRDGGDGGAGWLRGAEDGLAGGGERGPQGGERCECAVAQKTIGQLRINTCSSSIVPQEGDTNRRERSD